MGEIGRIKVSRHTQETFAVLKSELSQLKSVRRKDEILMKIKEQVANVKDCTEQILSTNDELVKEKIADKERWMAQQAIEKKKKEEAKLAKK
jgi:hypothetical protein